MSPRNLLVIVVDRLGAGFTGPYGATWLDTPGLNHLASESLLIEHVLADSPDLGIAYRSLWTGRHAMSPEAALPSLPALLSQAGWSTMLVTDDPELHAHPLASQFAERVQIPCRPPLETAARVEETQLARVFAEARARLARVKPPFLFWIHAQAMQGAWDAPWELRAQFADEDDPDPPEFVDPPVQMLPEKHDPDELLGIVHAYAGQVTALDLCLQSFLSDFLESKHAATTLLALTSPRGYPLGEHRRIGPVDHALYGEMLRTPLMFRFPEGIAAAYRAQAIAQPADVFATLADWAGVSQPSSEVWGRSLLPLAAGGEWPRDRAVAAHGRERAIRTPDWFLRLSPADHENADEPLRRELFAKPDDQWEVNEVSNRVPDAAEELTHMVQNFEEAVQRNDATHLIPLSEAVS